MREFSKNIFEILRLFTGIIVFIMPGLVITWVTFVLFFPDTLRRYDMSNLEMLVFFAGILGFSYLVYRATPWKKVMDFVAPIYLYDDWLGS